MLSWLKNCILGAILNSMPTLEFIIINEGFLYPVLLSTYYGRNIVLKAH